MLLLLLPRRCSEYGNPDKSKEDFDNVMKCVPGMGLTLSSGLGAGGLGWVGAAGAHCL